MPNSRRGTTPPKSEANHWYPGKTLALGFTPNTNLHFPAGQEDDTDSDDLEHEASMEDFETFLDGLQGKSFAEMKQLLMEERAEIMRVMLDQETTIRDRDRAAAETLNNSCADISWITATVSKDPDMIEYTGPIIKYLGNSWTWVSSGKFSTKCLIMRVCYLA